MVRGSYPPQLQQPPWGEVPPGLISFPSKIPILGWGTQPPALRGSVGWALRGDTGRGTQVSLQGLSAHSSSGTGTSHRSLSQSRGAGDGRGRQPAGPGGYPGAGGSGGRGQQATRHPGTRLSPPPPGVAPVRAGRDGAGGPAAEAAPAFKGRWRRGGEDSAVGAGWVWVLGPALHSGKLGLAVLGSGPRGFPPALPMVSPQTPSERG